MRPETTWSKPIFTRIEGFAVVDFHRAFSWTTSSSEATPDQATAGLYPKGGWLVARQFGKLIRWQVHVGEQLTPAWVGMKDVELGV